VNVYKNVGYEVIMAVIMRIIVFRDMMLVV
jgi:hypothetical protein